MPNMFKSIALLALASAPLASAAKCWAIGVRRTNSAGFGPGGTTVTGSVSIKLYREDEEVGEYVQCTNCASVCADFIAVPTDNLPFVFEWGATCATNNFKECHGAYSDQTHIEGEEPESNVDFYGVGESTDATCRVNFEC